jgi:hypothetical protein
VDIPFQQNSRELQTALKKFADHPNLSRGSETGQTPFSLLWEMFDFATTENAEYRGQNIYWREMVKMISKNIDDFRAICIRSNTNGS